VLDEATPEAEREQLPVRHHAVLSRRQLGQRHATWRA
jgi:hypothetical protein